jgi:uncharacterized RDD family membrane protein YckC
MARHTLAGVVLLAVLLLVCSAAFAASAGAQNAPTTAPSWNPGDLQAHGSDDRLWLAHVEPVPGRTPTEITYVYVREKSDATWRRLEPLGLRVVGLANRGSQLALLLPGGDWRLTTEAGYASGGPLPDGARLLTLGSDPATLWAIGLSREQSATTTQASTSPSTQSSVTPATPVMRSSPSSRPVATSAPSGQPRLVLYRLGAKDWEKQGGLPEEIPPSENVSLSLGVVGGSPLLAYKRDDRTVRVWHRGASAGAWDSPSDVTSNVDIAEHKLLSGTASPMLWYRGTSGPGHLWIAPSGSAAGKTADHPLASLPGVPAGVPHAVTFANNAVREILIADGKIYEQRLNPLTGVPEGEPALAILPSVSLQGVVVRVLEVTLAIALVLALLSSMRRRGELTEGELDPAKFRLAPFGLRLTAGVIDAVPIFVASGITWARPSVGQPTASEWIIMAAGVGVYLLLTTVVELTAGRSIGKMLTGLHVVGLDGRPASAGARVLRNLFRIIDVLIIGMPLALILFSPLRQRAGDLGAGTVVVQGRAEEQSEPAENSDDTPARRRHSDADSE